MEGLIGMEENLIKDQISSIGGERHNVAMDIAHLRDTFLLAEREYVLELLKRDYIIEMITQLYQVNPEILCKKAEQIIQDVEFGLIPEEEMEITEQRLTVLLAAIQDKVFLKMLSLGNYSSNIEEKKTSRSL